MKPLITLVILLGLFSCTAVADHIGIFTDESGIICYLTNPVFAPAVNSFYIIHRYNTGATASQFKVNDTTGLFAVSQLTSYSALGTWNTDLSLAFGGCVVGDHLLMTLNFLWFGAPVPEGCDHTLTPAAAPTSPLPGAVAVVDCAEPDANVKAASAGAAMFTSTLHECAPQCASPVAESTWGSVKALYR